MLTIGELPVLLTKHYEQQENKKICRMSILQII